MRIFYRIQSESEKEQGESEKGRGRFGKMRFARGRSMIEMLGVLAIIGVLSAGGTWGYNAAMEDYKINSIYEEIYSMIGQIQYVFAKNPSRSEYFDGLHLYKMGILPAKYEKKFLIYRDLGRDSYYRSPICSQIRFHLSTPNKGNKKFSVWFIGLSSKRCVKLTTSNYVKGKGIKITALNRRYNYSASYSLPLTPTFAENFCKDQEWYTILAFYF